MRKILGILLTACFIAGLLVTSALAATDVKVYATHDTDDGARTYKIATEAYDKTNGLTAAALGPAEYLVITTGTLNPISISLSLQNGQFYSATNTYYLAVWTDDADGVIEDGELEVVTDNAGNALAGGAAAGALTFDPGDGNGLHQDTDNDGVVEDIPAGSTLVIVDDPDGDPTATDPVAAEVGVNFGVDKDLTAGDVVTVTVTENAGTAYEQTATTTLAEIFNEYVAAVSQSADAVIDVGASPSRTLFTGGATQDTVQVRIADRNAIDTSGDPYDDSVDHTGTFLITQAQNGGSVDDITITLYGSNQAIETVNDGADLTYDETNQKWESTSVTDVSNGGVATCTFTITVTGTDVINVRSFQVGIVSVNANDDYYEITYLPSDTGAGSWTLNGYQSVIPYVPFGYSGYVAFLKLNNRSTVTGDITVDAIIHDFTAGTDTTVENASLGTSEAGKIMTISQSDLANALGLDSTHQYHVSLTITVNVPEDQCEVAAFQKDAVGRTMLPVYPTGGALVQ